MTSLTGTAPLIRFVVRRDRVRTLVWVASIVLLVVVSAASVKGLFRTQADLDKAAAVTGGNAAVIAFKGPAQGLDTLGGEVAFQIGSLGLVMVSLMSLLVIGRLTRGEEEAGRLEILRSLPVGVDAPTAAALATVVAMNLAVGSLVALSLLAVGLPAVGSVNFGLSFGLVGTLFAAVALVAAQVTENTRVVYGISGAALGAAFALRAVGDIGDGTLSWLSPIGWAQKGRPFAGERWWPFLLIVVTAAGLILVARVLATRRDLGAGLVPPRPGPAEAAPGLGRPLGLALRLQRGSVVGWAVGMVLLGVAYGSIADSIGRFVGDNQTVADLIARAGGASLIDSYLASSMQILALMGTGFAIQSTLRLRSEEASQHAEPVLATAVSRARWAGSHLAVAFGGSVLLLVGAGLAMGVSYALAGGGAGAVPRMLGAALVYAPAVWVIVGLAMALVGWAPRAVVATWAVLGTCFLVGLLGSLLGLPGWLTTVSPFEHVPLLPAADLTVLPLAVLTAVAGGLTWVGVGGLRRRDIG